MDENAKQEALRQLTDERLRLDRVKVIAEASPSPFRLGGMFGSLIFAYMWLGKAKGSLGAGNPYPSSTDPSNRKIEPSVDRAENVKLPDQAIMEDTVLLIKFLRSEMDGIIKAIWNDMSIFPQHVEYQLCIQNAWTYAVNTKLQLGLGLERIREEEKNEKNNSEQAPGTVPPAGNAPIMATGLPNTDPLPPMENIPLGGNINEEPLQGEDLINKRDEDLQKVEDNQLEQKSKKAQENAATTNGGNSTAGKNKNKRPGNSKGKKPAANTPS